MVMKSGGKNSGGDKPLGVLSPAIRLIHEARMFLSGVQSFACGEPVEPPLKACGNDRL
jgi:hypothetical protein